MQAHGLRSIATIAVLLAGAGASIALAQPQGAVNAQGQTSQGTIGVQKKAVLGPQEQLEQADAIGHRATRLGERLTRMLDEARRDKDIMRANCVNRKLTEVNANARNVEQRSKALKDAVGTGDEGRRNHEYTVLTVIAQKLDALNLEASQCLGQSMYEPGASQVITTVPKDAPTIDPTVVGSPPPPPPAVSVPPPLGPVAPVSPTN